MLDMGEENYEEKLMEEYDENDKKKDRIGIGEKKKKKNKEESEKEHEIQQGTKGEKIGI